MNALGASVFRFGSVMLFLALAIGYVEAHSVGI